MKIQVPQGQRTNDGTLFVQVAVDAKAIFLLGGVVYFAARAAVRRELKKTGGRTVFNQYVAGPMKEGVDKALSDLKDSKMDGTKGPDDSAGPVIPQQPSGE